MIAALLLAATTAAAVPTARLLSADTPVRESLAGGETKLFAIDVPAQTAARIVVRQEGIDTAITMRIAGSDLPEHGLDMVSGTSGEETRYVPIGDAPVTWNVFIKASTPRAPRGDLTITLDLRAADDAARAIAANRQLYQETSDLDWLGTTEKTKSMYETVAERAIANGDKDLAANATYEAARRHDVLGDVPGAIEWQKRALAMFRETGQIDRQGRALNRLGDLSRKVGEIRASEEYFKEAMPLARQSGDRVNEADILNNSAMVTLTLGRPEEALEQVQAAIPLAKELDSANVEVALWMNCADAYQILGMPEKSVDALEKAVDRVRHSNLPERRLGRALHGLAAAYFEIGERTKAEVAMREALEHLERAKDISYLGQAIVVHARMQNMSGDRDAAIESLTRALPMLQQAQALEREGDALRLWSAIDFERGGAEEALAKVKQALALARQVFERRDEAEALYLRARILARMKRTGEAIASIEEGIAVVEAMRAELTRADFRTSYLTTVRGYYDLYVDLLQQSGKTSAAFQASERARARTLLENLGTSRAKIRKGVDPELLRRERGLQAELNAKGVYRAQLALKDGKDSARVLAVQHDLEQLIEEWRAVQAKIRTTSPAYDALQTPRPVDTATVQKSLLDADTALVEYHLAEPRSYAWVVNRKAITACELESAPKIDRLARRYHELLSRSAKAADIEKAAKALEAAVWKPVASRVAGKRLLIVADGALQYVPFGALGGPHPLIVDHEIIYLPSASVLATIARSSRRPRAATVAVFADPVFNRDDPRLTGRRDEPIARSDVRGGQFTRLHFSRKEADAITALVPRDRAMEAVDFAAAKKTLIEADLRRYRVLHFATHGVLDTEHPELSGLVLSLVNREGHPVDGFLRLHEIYNLNLDADLVVLSACSTALGKEMHGEGLIGLTRGFMYAGAARVVSSIWNVDDRASALLMSRFYKAMLGKGLPAAAALREAQLSLLHEARWKNPHYWAAFSLQGEWH